ncbi:hypothetical protein DPMN_170136 [Dreissena polymorpha]|uniref:Uncharacterized protein n=1 Tax=Dreissena polymorpha TaxID=45954 RepID=A0A9D4IEB5_DREPO|nr:hypothetical protein DPMN_170136 [Dreissena polymorpha]
MEMDWPCTEDGQRFHSESGTPMDPRRQNKARETQADLETHSGRGNKSHQPLVGDPEKACKRPTTV